MSDPIAGCKINQHRKPCTAEWAWHGCTRPMGHPDHHACACGARPVSNDVAMTTNLPVAPRCAHCPAFMTPRPQSQQTPEQKATGPWWDHPPVLGQIGLFGHTVAMTFGGVR